MTRAGCDPQGQLAGDGQPIEPLFKPDGLQRERHEGFPMRLARTFQAVRTDLELHGTFGARPSLKAAQSVRMWTKRVVQA